MFDLCEYTETNLFKCFKNISVPKSDNSIRRNKNIENHSLARITWPADFRFVSDCIGSGCIGKRISCTGHRFCENFRVFF